MSLAASIIARSMRLPLTLPAAALSLFACKNSPSEPLSTPSYNTPRIGDNPPSAGAQGAQAPRASGRELTWTDPAAWRRVQPSSSMRRAQYAVPGTSGEGELTVFYFGAGQGGDTESNLTRWYSQLTQPDGRETRAVATRESLTVGALRVTVTAATGRFTAGGMPGGAPAAPRENHALLGAIVETPEGPWFFKLTGPAATLSAARPAFDDLVRSVRF